MRKLFTVVVLLICFTSAFSQEKVLVVSGTSPNLYIKHTVEPKENYYSVGRMYNVSPKELAPYNNLEFEKGFTIGQVIKVPLASTNFSQGEAPNENEVLVPVHHITQPKEGLYRVSVNYNKVPLDQLKKWNRLSSDNVSTGSKLIVGFLKVLKDQSPLASQAIKINSGDFVVKQPEEKKPVVIAAKEEKIQEPEEKVKKPADKVPVEINNVQTANTINFNGGKFKSLFTDQGKGRNMQTENGIGAIFKTTSGWQDGKYYCFHNTAEPGTIIKVTNNANGRSVYAKVLDAIPDIKQNTGLLLRISNSAADELGVTDTKFDCSVSYAK